MRINNKKYQRRRSLCWRRRKRIKLNSKNCNKDITTNRMLLKKES